MPLCRLPIDQKGKFSVTSLVLCFPQCWLWTNPLKCKQAPGWLNAFLKKYELPWSWCLCPAIELPCSWMAIVLYSQHAQGSQFSSCPPLHLSFSSFDFVFIYSSHPSYPDTARKGVSGILICGSLMISDAKTFSPLLELQLVECWISFICLSVLILYLFSAHYFLLYPRIILWPHILIYYFYLMLCKFCSLCHLLVNFSDNFFFQFAGIVVDCPPQPSVPFVM